MRGNIFYQNSMNGRQFTPNDIFDLTNKANGPLPHVAEVARMALKAAFEAGESAFLDKNVFAYTQELRRIYPAIFGRIGACSA